MIIMAQKQASPATQQPDTASAAPGESASDLSDALAIANRLRPVLLRLHRVLRTEAHELLTSPTLVNHIDKLEAAGFVERVRSHPTDRRRVELTITAAGTQVLQTLRERRTAWLAAHLEKLSAEELAAIAIAIEPLAKLVRQPS